MNLSKDDAIFFLDMIDSGLSPNHSPEFFKRKPISKFVKNRKSVEYQRFKHIALELIPLIEDERQLIVLKSRWGFNDKVETLDELAAQLGLKGRETVRTIQKKAERKIAIKLNVLFNFRDFNKHKEIVKEEESQSIEDDLVWYYRRT